jgi:DNA integrity scanning protein DisA with diadenylate cyclase activity
VKKEEHQAMTRTILAHAKEIGRSLGVKAILVYADVFADKKTLSDFSECNGITTIILTKDRASTEECREHCARVLQVPNINLPRLGQIKVGVLLSLSRGLIQKNDRILCLSGIADSGVLDTMVFLEVGVEIELLSSSEAVGITSESKSKPEIFERVLDLAVSLAQEGREGKPIGTCFVIGDPDRLTPFTRQIILNPFRGYPEEERNILDPAIEKTIKELSAIDGAFIIREDGLIQSAGTYLAAGTGDVFLPQGLGARHQSAAYITSNTGATAITISESTGTVSVFREGKILTEIEKRRFPPPTTPASRVLPEEPGK